MDNEKRRFTLVNILTHGVCYMNKAIRILNLEDVPEPCIPLGCMFPDGSDKHFCFRCPSQGSPCYHRLRMIGRDVLFYFG
jgi:hypothetical protein